MYKKWIKAPFDFFVALMLLLLLSPLMILLALVSVILNQENPFFFQDRPGKNGRIFKLVKLKTMRDKFDRDGQPLPDMMRITKFGSFIRRASLDEIPQLINVLTGDMSLVGPRPLLVRYLPLYSDFQRRRHEVKPGITGWAQVNGRNTLAWDEKFKLDVWYVDNFSFRLDLKILLLTVKKIFIREGVNNSEHNTMEEFKGMI